MAMDFSKICLTHEAIDIPEAVPTDEAGAILDFLGVVRGKEESREISGLDYECYAEMAAKKLALIADESAERYGLHEVTLIHRVGFVACGEVSLFLRVSSSHRNAAFNGSQAIVERLKQEVPIWKNPVTKNL